MGTNVVSKAKDLYVDFHGICFKQMRMSVIISCDDHDNV